MKSFRYLLLMVIGLAFTVSSCTNDDDAHGPYHLEYVGVTSADVPDEFIYGYRYQLDVTIALPSSCYYFYNQYDYFYEGTSRLIYPIAHVHDDEPCTLAITEVTFSIPVQALQTEPYLFKFYQGEDENGEDQFLEIEVPVVQNQ